MKSHPATINGKHVLFNEINDAKKFLDMRETLNRAAHRESGGWRPEDYGYRERCGITGEILTPEDGVYLAITNGADVPNKSVSKKLVDQLGFQRAADQLNAAWGEAQALAGKYLHWFV